MPTTEELSEQLAAALARISRLEATVEQLRQNSQDDLSARMDRLHEMFDLGQENIIMRLIKTNQRMDQVVTRLDLVRAGLDSIARSLPLAPPAAPPQE